jgi:hypothetical protein
MKQEETPMPSHRLKNYFLLFETYYGQMLGWCIRTGLPVESIPSQIEAAAEEWWDTTEGIKHRRGEGADGQPFDYAYALMNVPHMLLAKYHVHLWTPIEQIIRLDAEVNLAPKEPQA